MLKFKNFSSFGSPLIWQGIGSNSNKIRHRVCRNIINLQKVITTYRKNILGSTFCRLWQYDILGLEMLSFSWFRVSQETSGLRAGFFQHLLKFCWIVPAILQHLQYFNTLQVTLQLKFHCWLFRHSAIPQGIVWLVQSIEAKYRCNTKHKTYS